MSLQTGTRLALTRRAIIDPSTLTIIAYEIAEQEARGQTLLLRLEDVRELSQVGFIVDSSDEFVEPEDVVKLHEVYQLQFTLNGLSVQNERGKRLGRVSDYTVDTATFTVYQLNVKRPLLRSFKDSELIINRAQIIEISGEAITIKETSQGSAPAVIAKQSYINPFRKTSPATNSSGIRD